MKMQVREVIANINSLAKVIKKDVSMPYSLRRAIRKNYATLYEEYRLFDEERMKIITPIQGADEGNMSVEELSTFKKTKEEIGQKIDEMLNAEVDIQIIKVSETALENVDLTVSDEIAIEFMIEEVE